MKSSTAGPSAPPPQPSGAQPSGGQPSKRLQQTQEQVDEVFDIMRVNVQKVLERDQKLTELDARADALQDGAREFENNYATRHKRKYWWQNCKMWLLFVSIITIITIVSVVTTLRKSYSSGGSDNTTVELFDSDNTTVKLSDSNTTTMYM